MNASVELFPWPNPMWLVSYRHGTPPGALESNNISGLKIHRLSRGHTRKEMRECSSHSASLKRPMNKGYRDDERFSSRPY